MDLDEIRAGLVELGLDAEESWVYLQLLRGGPEKAGRLARISEFSRSKMYRVLDELVDLHVVKASAGNPTVFSAREPDLLFERKQSEVERELQRVQGLRQRLLADLEELATGEEDEERIAPSWKVLQGRERIYDHVVSMAQEARNEMAVVSNHGISTHLTPPVQEAWEEVVSWAEEGGSWRTLMEVPEDEGHRFERYLTADGVEFRPIPDLPPVHFIVRDREAVMMWAVMDPSNRLRDAADVAIWSDAEGAVTPLCALFDRLWEEAGENLG